MHVQCSYKKIISFILFFSSARDSFLVIITEIWFRDRSSDNIKVFSMLKTQYTLYIIVFVLHNVTYSKK